MVLVVGLGKHFYPYIAMWYLFYVPVSGGGCFLVFILLLMFGPPLLAWTLTVVTMALIPTVIIGVPLGLVRTWQNENKTVFGDTIKTVFKVSVVLVIILLVAVYGCKM